MCANSACCPTVITVGFFLPTCIPHRVPELVGPWEDFSGSQEHDACRLAEEHVSKRGSLMVAGVAGCGNTTWCKKALANTPRIFWCAKTHVASQNLSENGMTVARLYRRYVSTGAVTPDCTCVFDEISLLSTRDFELVVLPLARLGCQTLRISCSLARIPASTKTFRGIFPRARC